MTQQTILVMISQPDEVVDDDLEQFEVSIDKETGVMAARCRCQKASVATFRMPAGKENDSDLFSMQARHEISEFIDEALAGKTGKLQ